MQWLSDLSLNKPILVAAFCITVGFGLGIAFELFWFEDHFGRFGSVTVALGVLTFGATAADLLIRGQVGRYADQFGDLPYPYSRQNLAKVMGVQSVVVVVGTLQWGFGDLLKVEKFHDFIF